MTDKALVNRQMCSYLTWTTPHTHQIIRDNLYRAPLYGAKNSLHRAPLLPQYRG